MIINNRQQFQIVYSTIKSTKYVVYIVGPNLHACTLMDRDFAWEAHFKV
jgi:hypothetical protein